MDGHDPEAIKAVTRKARAESAKPTLICCKTVIGKGAPNKQDGYNVHGEALGEEEIAATREVLGWSHSPFEVPDDIYVGQDTKEKGKTEEANWDERFAAYVKAYPAEAAEFTRPYAGKLSENCE